MSEEPTVVEVDGVYHLKLKTKTKRLTNFVIRHVQDGAPNRYQLIQSGKVQHTITIPPAAWESRGAFLTAFNGIGNYGFFGRTSAEVRAIKRRVHGAV